MKLFFIYKTKKYFLPLTDLDTTEKYLDLSKKDQLKLQADFAEGKLSEKQLKEEIERIYENGRIS